MKWLKTHVKSLTVDLINYSVFRGLLTISCFEILKETKKVNNRKWDEFKAAFLKLNCPEIKQGTANQNCSGIIES